MSAISEMRASAGATICPLSGARSHAGVEAVITLEVWEHLIWKKGHRFRLLYNSNNYLAMVKEFIPEWALEKCLERARERK